MTTDQKVKSPSSMNGYFLTEINEISNSSDYQDYQDVDFDTSGIAVDVTSTKVAVYVSPRILGTTISESSEKFKSIKEIGRVRRKALS